MIALALGGCRSSSSGMAGSPFMSPDRVPPPNTRALAPRPGAALLSGRSAARDAECGQSPGNRHCRPPERRRRTIRLWPDARLGSTRSRRAVASPNQPGPSGPGAAARSHSRNRLRPRVKPRSPCRTTVIRCDSRCRLPRRQKLPLQLPRPLRLRRRPSRFSRSPYNRLRTCVQTTYNAPIPSAPPLPVSSPDDEPTAARSPRLGARRKSLKQRRADLRAAAVRRTAERRSALALPAPPAIPANTMAATLRAVESPPQPGDPMPRVRMPGYVASQASADGFRPRTSMQ